MWKEIINAVVPIIITCIIGILVTIVKFIGDALIALIASKKEEVIKKIGLAKYEENKSIAYDIWNIVEEHFRITEFIGSSIQLKISMFDELLLKKIPGLTQSEIDYLRQAVAGEINKGKKTITNINTTAIDTQQLTDLQNKAQAYDKLQSALQSVSSDIAKSQSDASTNTSQNNSASQPAGQVNASLV